MRILYIVNQVLPESSTRLEVFAMNIAKMQQRNGHHVDVLTCSVGATSASDDETNGLRRGVDNGIPIYAIPQMDLGSLEMSVPYADKMRRMLSRFIEQGAYDVAHVTHSMRMQAAIDVVRDFSVPYVVTLTDYYALCHRANLRRDASVCAGLEKGMACNALCTDSAVKQEIIDDRSRWIASLLRNANSVIASSEFVARIFQAELPEVNIRVHHHGVNLRDFQPPLTKKNARDLLFGYIGTFSEQKGVVVLAEAFRQAAPVNAVLELIGSSYDDTATLQRLEAICNDKIRIIGPVDHCDIPRTLGRFDVLCVPSAWPDPGTLALREGFAAGVPALVSDIGCPGETIRMFGCGAAVPPGDVDAWCRAIRNICERPELLHTWRKSIPMQLTIEEEAFFYEQLYRYALCDCQN